MASWRVIISIFLKKGLNTGSAFGATAPSQMTNDNIRISAFWVGRRKDTPYRLTFFRDVEKGF